MSKKIAIPVDESGVLDAHFGHCKYFLILTIEKDEIVEQKKVVPPPHEPGLLPGWVANQGATDIIAGGMGQRAIQLFNQSGVNVFVGAPKMTAEELVAGFLKGTLQFTANYCDH
ncbi:MAG: NifB/NifX family molybdenum-iron cluster-binding protein [Bacteroidales bacterium]|nr:NifB/NifX family molybdenum-iron cluster-binding protein [Bacteroidales bacterium]